MSLTIVMYHYVRPIHGSAYPNIKGLELDGFVRQLDYLSAHYTPIRAEELIAAVRHGEALPEDACLLSFDDGYKDHVRHVLPELQKRKLQGSFFPPAAVVQQRKLLDVNRVHFILEKVADPGELVGELDDLCRRRGITEAALDKFHQEYEQPGRFDPGEIIYVKRMLQHALPGEIRHELAKALFAKFVGRDESDFADELYISRDEAKLLVDCGMYVGGHGDQHVWLNRCDPAAQQSEFDATLRFLESIGSPTRDWMLSFPYGAYNGETLKLCGIHRCAVGLTTRVAMADLETDPPLELPRLDTNDFPR